MMPCVHILLPVHNRLSSIKRFIGCLQAQAYTNYHLILIDDGSTDGTQGYVKENIQHLTILTGQGDWWWAGGLHQGYGWLKKNKVMPEDIALMINGDTEFGSDFFQKALEILSQHHKTLLLPKVYSRKTGKLLETGVHVNWRRLSFEATEDPQMINCFTTRALFLRVGDLMDIGGFHPILLPHYLSDYEFTIRAHRKGYRLMLDPFSKLMVDESTTGAHGLDRKASRVEFFKEYFSKRSASNPFYWFTMVALASPWAWKPLNFLRVVIGAFETVFRKTFGIYNYKWR